MIEERLILLKCNFQKMAWLLNGAQVRLSTQLALFVEDGKMKEGKMKEGKGKAPDVWEVKTVFISGGWLEVTQVEPPLLPYTVPVFARQSIADPRKG